MYKKDEHGEYRQTNRWVDAWGGGGAVPGWSICEVREYANGKTRVHRGEARYLHEHPSPEIYALHAVYMSARKGLGA